jgi:hypothetical protein
MSNSQKVHFYVVILPITFVHALFGDFISRSEISIEFCVFLPFFPEYFFEVLFVLFGNFRLKSWGYAAIYWKMQYNLMIYFTVYRQTQVYCNVLYINCMLYPIKNVLYTGDPMTGGKGVYKVFYKQSWNYFCVNMQHVHTVLWPELEFMKCIWEAKPGIVTFSIYRLI